jgi:YHS domain-containing protein
LAFAEEPDDGTRIEKKGSSMGQVWDVVCGMQGNDQEWQAKSEYRDRTFFFCCDGCKGAFERSPEYHLENFQEEHPEVDPTGEAKSPD